MQTDIERITVKATDGELYITATQEYDRLGDRGVHRFAIFDRSGNVMAVGEQPQMLYGKINEGDAHLLLDNYRWCEEHGQRMTVFHPRLLAA